MRKKNYKGRVEKRPLTCKLLDASRLYWKSHGVNDWGIVIDKGINGYSLGFKGVPKWFIGNHIEITLLKTILKR